MVTEPWQTIEDSRVASKTIRGMANGSMDCGLAASLIRAIANWFVISVRVTCTQSVVVCNHGANANNITGMMMCLLDS